jgi:hypothetical protein
VETRKRKKNQVKENKEIRLESVKEGRMKLRM